MSDRKQDDRTRVAGPLLRGQDWAWLDWKRGAFSDDEVDQVWAQNFAARESGRITRPLDVYTHFPFCRSSCSFCMYRHTVAADGAHRRYVDELLRRLRAATTGRARIQVEHAYWGGGTPTAISPDLALEYLAEHSRAFEVSGEFTMEGHPATIELSAISEFADGGVNRLSMGIQTLDPRLLQTITRANGKPERIQRVVETASACGMRVNVDLVVGLPDQDIQGVLADVEAVLGWQPSTVTLYFYQPVPGLPAPPVSTLLEGNALDRVQEAASKLGYAMIENLDSALLVPKSELSDLETAARYHNFGSRTPERDLFGLGSGATSHAYGIGWYRDDSRGSDGSVAPRYFGTRLTELDERMTQARLLVSGWRGGKQELIDTLRESLGSDIADVVENAAAKDDGGEERSGLLRELLSPGCQELAELETRGRAQNALQDRFREVLGMGPRGKRYKSAWIKRIDNRSIFFSVGHPHAPEFRVFVESSAEGNHYRTIGEFGISYGGEPRPEDEEFLAELLRDLTAALQ